MLRSNHDRLWLTSKHSLAPIHFINNNKKYNKTQK